MNLNVSNHLPGSRLTSQDLSHNRSNRNFSKLFSKFQVSVSFNIMFENPKHFSLVSLASKLSTDHLFAIVLCNHNSKNLDFHSLKSEFEKSLCNFSTTIHEFSYQFSQRKSFVPSHNNQHRTKIKAIVPISRSSLQNHMEISLQIRVVIATTDNPLSLGLGIRDIYGRISQIPLCSRP